MHIQEFLVFYKTHNHLYENIKLNDITLFDQLNMRLINIDNHLLIINTFIK
jgi:hypothetical protein